MPLPQENTLYTWLFIKKLFNKLGIKAKNDQQKNTIIVTDMLQEADSLEHLLIAKAQMQQQFMTIDRLVLNTQLQDNRITIKNIKEESSEILSYQSDPNNILKLFSNISQEQNSSNNLLTVPARIQQQFFTIDRLLLNTQLQDNRITIKNIKEESSEILSYQSDPNNILKSFNNISQEPDSSNYLLTAATQMQQQFLSLDCEVITIKSRVYRAIKKDIKGKLPEILSYQSDLNNSFQLFRNNYVEPDNCISYDLFQGPNDHPNKNQHSFDNLDNLLAILSQNQPQSLPLDHWLQNIEIQDDRTIMKNIKEMLQAILSYTSNPNSDVQLFKTNYLKLNNFLSYDLFRGLNNNCGKSEQDIEVAYRLLCLQVFKDTTILTYKAILFRLIDKDTPEELLMLAELFLDIGNLYIKCTAHGKSFLKDLTDAAIHNMYARSATKYALAHKEFNQENVEKSQLLISEYDQQLKTIHELIIDDLKIDITTIHKEELILKNIDELSQKTTLTNLRSNVDTKIKTMDAVKKDDNCKEYVKQSYDLFKYCTTGIKDYLKSLYEEAEKILGDAPCHYEVIGLGSMALNQMTPYSDLEFAILIEESKEKNYFQKLTYYVYFKIICLQETVMAYSYYPDNTYKLGFFVKPGIMLDLGGKTPLGRISKDKTYDLIGTIEEIFKYFQNLEKKTEKCDANLPFILEKACFVYGSKGSDNLYIKYQGAVKKFLDEVVFDSASSLTNGEARAIQKLLYGKIEINAANTCNKGKVITIPGNLTQFTFNPYVSTKQGKVFDIKQELYRLIDRLIYDLSLIYNVDNGSAWDTVIDLYKKGFITKEVSNRLITAITFVNTLRLKAYQYYGCQKEQLTVQLQDKETTDVKNTDELPMFSLDPGEIKGDGGLTHFFYTFLPLYKKLGELCSKLTKENFTPAQKKEFKDSFFKDKNLYDNTDKNKFAICLRILKYKDVEKYVNKTANSISTEMDEFDRALALKEVGTLYYELEKYKEALSFQIQAIEIYRKLIKPELITSSIREDYTIKLVKLFANNSFSKCKPVRIIISDTSKIDFNFNDYLLLLLQNKDDIEKKVDLINQVIGSIKSISSILYNLRDLESHLNFEILDLLFAIKFKSSQDDYNIISNKFLELSEVYLHLKDYKNAYDCLIAASKISIKYDVDRHNNLGCEICIMQEDFKQAQFLAEKVFKRSGQNKDLLDIVKANHNLGIVWCFKTDERNEDYNKSLSHFTNIIKIYDAKYGEMNPHTALHHTLAGFMCVKLSNYSKAQSHLQIAFNICKTYFAPKHLVYSFIESNARDLCDFLTENTDNFNFSTLPIKLVLFSTNNTNNICVVINPVDANGTINMSNSINMSTTININSSKALLSDINLNDYSPLPDCQASINIFEDVSTEVLGNSFESH